MAALDYARLLVDIFSWARRYITMPTTTAQLITAAVYIFIIYLSWGYVRQAAGAVLWYLITAALALVVIVAGYNLLLSPTVQKFFGEHGISMMDGLLDMVKLDLPERKTGRDKFPG